MAVVEAHAGVVAGGDVAGADGIGHFEEAVELDVVVAEGARDGRAAGEILFDEGLHHVLFELLLEVDHVVGDADLFGDAAGVVDIVERAAAAGSGGRSVFGGEFRQPALVPQLHGHADHGAALAHQHGGDGGAVDAAAHGDGDG